MVLKTMMEYPKTSSDEPCPDMTATPPHAATKTSINEIGSHSEDSHTDFTDSIQEPSPLESPHIDTDVDMDGSFSGSTAVSVPASSAPCESDPVLLSLLKKQFPLDPAPNFKSVEQRQLVVMALKREESLIAVLPTGGGKSLSFMLPTWCEPELETHVIVPNKALIDDFLFKCQELKILAHRWLKSDPMPPPQTKLVFLAVESAVTQAYSRYTLNTCLALHSFD